MNEFERYTRALREQLDTTPSTTDPNVLRDYAVDGIEPRLLATPRTVEEVAQVVALAHEHHLTVLPRGAGSHMNLGGLAERIDVLLSTQKLDRLLEHEGPDMTCHVEAGMTLAALQTRLATKGQRLALDPVGAEQTTIGGLLASNASGPKRLRTGTARDLLIGLRLVQANGEVSRNGGRVVKNVAGYDLNKLYIGSLGTLGIIVEANFKLHPLPVAERTLLLTSTHLEEAMQMVLALTASALTPCALELIDPAAATDMADFFGFHLPTDVYTLAVNFEGSPRAIARQLDEARLLARGQNVVIGDTLDGDAQDAFWQAVRAHTRGVLTCKVSLPVTQITGYMRHLEGICHTHDIESATVAHAGNGILYIELRPADAIPRLLAAIAELRIQARTARGSLVVERCPVELKRVLNVWGEPGADFVLMQRLKHQFDPDGTFVRGRFMGGL